MRRLLSLLRRRARSRLTHIQHRVTFLRNEVQVARGSYIAPGVVIGRRTKINAPSHLDLCEIGAYCAIGGRLVVRSGNHYTQFLGIQEEAQRRVVGASTVLRPLEPVKIGHGVWIGDSVVICPGVSIGNGAVIGAGSVVTKSVPAYAIVAGNPARFLRWRYPSSVIAQIETVEWWTWSDARLRSNRALFEIDLTSVDPADLGRLLTRTDP